MRSYIVFRLGPEEFGVDIENVVEIFKPQKVYEVPEMQDYVPGVINIRESVIPLIDLRKRFGLKPSPKKERIVLVRSSDETLGLIVDEIKEILGFEAEEISKPPTIFKGLASEYLVGLGKKEDRVVILLSLDNILSREERMRLDVSQNSMQDTQ